MSFAAVAALIACYEAMRPRLSRWHAHAGLRARASALYLFGIAFTTLVTTVATMPFTIYHFNRFPLYSVAGQRARGADHRLLGHAVGDRRAAC